jgi:flagellar motor switch protein FliM
VEAAQAVPGQAQGAGAAGPGGATPADGVHEYDFRQPNHISKDRLRAIEAKYGTMCKAIEAWLSTRVRAAVELNLASVEQVSFGEFTRQLHSPAASYIYNVTDTSDQVVIDFGPEMAFFLVDRLLGSNDEPAIEDRTLTVLERMVVRIAADQVSSQLMAIWKDRVALKLSLDRFESEPELLRTANREDPMLVTQIDVKAGNVASVMAVCMPLTVLEDFLTAGGSKHQIGRGTAEERSIDRSAVENALRQANVDVSVRSPAFGMLLSDLNRVRQGCVIRTGLAPDANLTLRIEGAPRFIGQAGRADRALAVRIIGTEARESDERVDTTGRPRIMGSMVEPGLAGGKDGLDLAELESAGNGSAAPLSNISQITLPVTIELGRTRMAVQDVLELGRGSVVVLDRLVGEPVDVIVGDRPFAEGEVVVIGEQFGVRITRIHSSAKNGKAQK